MRTLHREYSPGEHLVDRAINDLEMTTFETVIDFGCGTGRAAKKFQDQGFSIVGVDIAPEALETDVPLIQACLWHMPDMYADWGFCTDVMEHIPPEKVQPVLKQIRARTKKGVFFQIALTKDSFGDRIGERLHLTIEPMEWWVEQILKHWGYVKGVQTSVNAAIIVCKPTSSR